MEMIMVVANYEHELKYLVESTKVDEQLSVENERDLV